MKRYASLDFLRGIAIILMLILHIISDTLDIDTLTSDLSVLPLFQLILLIILPYLGGLAGFFLMVSSIGNMISMQKHLQKGLSFQKLITRQIVGGFLLLLFAMLSESILGYHGMIGEIFKNLDNLSDGTYDQYRWRFLYFETVNAIAWCVILNGIVHAFLSKQDRWKNPKFLIKMYALLTILVLALTPVMWKFADIIIPGYPYAIDPNTGKSVLFGVIGQTSFGQIILRFFLGPLAASWEPIFPYLACSFIGSMFGVYLAQDPPEIKFHWLKNYMFFGLAMFVVGTIGLITNLAFKFLSPENGGIDGALNLYLLISEHRYWTQANGVPFAGWLFQFLTLNGFTLCCIVLMFRLVEFRGLGSNLAKNSYFIRRVGLIPFTIYTMQWVYILFHFVVSQMMGYDAYARLSWTGTIAVIIFTLIVFYVLTLVWEKMGYFGSLEWIIGTVAAIIVSSKRKTTSTTWWRMGQLDIDQVFYNAEWIHILPPPHPEGKAGESLGVFDESRFSLKCGILGFFFVPFSIVAFRSALKLQKQQEKNQQNQTAKILGIIGIFWGAISFTFLFLVKLTTFNISI